MNKPQPVCTLLEWERGDSLPDADERRLLWIEDEAGDTDWDTGWWDGQCWRLCESGGVVPGTVVAHASVEGPTC